MENQSTDKLELAAKFVNNTGAPIFLTGKAGTGKTTFLKSLAQQTHKNHVIVAPTGIAALNAGGVTIHSQFLFPIGFFLPVKEPEGNFSDQYGCFTQHTLSRKHPLNALRKNVLKSIELLVIDEVSMLRADVLDAIDYRLRSVKRNYSAPFGGVQVLMIGDLFQLPPIVRDNEWQILSKFYPSMHFFEARVLQDSGLVYLELDKIFRQQDEDFIEVLNHLRENRVTAEDVALLNKHYKTQDEIAEIKDCITITTHNYKADQINRDRLMALKGQSKFYEADIEKDFPENIYPLPKSLELRVGAQVMFIKNDSTGNQDYFNGKLATVEELEDDQIRVLLEGKRFVYQLRKEIWENKKYIINPDTKELEEEVIGTFSQYPIKTAWAVTVHKSQGLTFDQAIIDVGNAFAPGQVYVALSRLRSMEGLVLRTRIQNNALQSDSQVQTFVESAKHSKLDELLGAYQQRYLSLLSGETFDLQGLLQEINSFQRKNDSSMEFEDPEMQKAVGEMATLIRNEVETAGKFSNQLRFLLQQNDKEKLMERLEKGSIYFKDFLKNALAKILLHRAEVERFSRTKTYANSLEELEVSLLRKYGDISKVSRLIASILDGEIPGKMNDLEQDKINLRLRLAESAKQAAADNPKFASNKTGRKKAGKASLKRKVGETYEITFSMINEGKSIGDIVVGRGLAESTIKGHLAKGIAEGRVELEDCLPREVISEISSQIENIKNLQALRIHFEGKYDYNTIKMVVAGRQE
ncbi:helix-turn-helix domain-containing protein [Algoriphagus sp. C2-6-M1]|uniref:helix-turn-helix domain-containing protein n=1 Tax=Algoriphagus persicinus TaxID=3108754 RepID=UPI002B3EA97B|nr:helix-turn-helix domain-containing protein [Algoriphagus sp. C2-6-M1]MEB2779828.1 helix-turn-helix domain-containing protein [Algoriphagus sp. C2-6-M1]